MPCSPRSSVLSRNSSSMASSSVRLSADYLDVKRQLTADDSARNSDCETVNNEDDEERDDVQTETLSNTRSSRKKTQNAKKKKVRPRRVTANIAGTKYDVGKYKI